MPGILILHASLGTGHITAAAALEEAFQQQAELAVYTEDVLNYAGAVLRRTLKTLYEQVSERSPQLYRMLYTNTDTDAVEDAFNGNQRLSALERPFLSDLEEFIQQTAPDAIICVHPLPAHVLARCKQEGQLDAPLYVVVTDFLAHSTWLVPGVTRYFLPDDFTRRILLKRGLDPTLIEIMGIPIRREIADEKPKLAMRTRYGLPTDLPLITLFGGGIDPQRVRVMVTDLLDGESDGMLVVVAGRNERLEATLADLTDGPHMQFCCHGRINYVDDLVAASDLVITKAGGLIVSEVLARGKPMVIIDPLPGQEEWNADFVASVGAGIQLRMPESVPAAAFALLNEPERLAAMGTHARLVGRPHAARDTAACILKDIVRQVGG